MKLWKPGTEPNPQMGDWLQPLGLLRRFPSIGQLTGRQLRTAVKATNKHKAPGADGWTYLEMSDWSDPMIEVLAELLTLVERTGK